MTLITEDQNHWYSHVFLVRSLPAGKLALCKEKLHFGSYKDTCALELGCKPLCSPQIFSLVCLAENYPLQCLLCSRRAQCACSYLLVLPFVAWRSRSSRYALHNLKGSKSSRPTVIQAVIVMLNGESGSLVRSVPEIQQIYLAEDTYASKLWLQELSNYV